MVEHLPVPGVPMTSVVIRRSARARRMSLRVGRTDGQVTLSLPKRTPLAEAESFIAQQAGWIAKHVSRVPARHLVRVGGTLPLLGRDVAIVPGAGRVARYDGHQIAVPDDDKAGPRVKTLIQSLARTHLAEAVDRYAAALGETPAKITLRDTRSRWGSCSSRGDLMFSWRLVMAPQEVLDYVAAHEVAHLRHMDHSSRFWAVVGDLMPEYAPRRAWLRTDGVRLHAIDFAGG